MVVAAGKEVQSGVGFSVPIIVFGSIALYNVIELNYMVLDTFRRRRGLYFWSLMVATWGIAVNAIGYLFEHLQLIQAVQLYSSLICLGWVSMVTGASVVLYSRLYLVMPDDRRRRWVLWMIITDAIIMHTPIIVLVFGSNSPQSHRFVPVYMVYEKIQLSVFFLQEVIISGLYVSETIQLLRVMRDTHGKKEVRRVLTHLIFVNVIVIILDMSVLGLEFSDYYILQTGWKPLVYSMKLKMELTILNQLVALTKSREQSTFSMSTGSNPIGILETLSSPNQQDFRRDVGDETGYKVCVGVGSDGASAPGPAGVRREMEFVVGSERIGNGCFLRGRDISPTYSERDRSDAASVTSVTQLADAHLPNRTYI